MKRQIESLAPRALSAALCIVMALALLPAAQAVTITPTSSNNVNGQEYANGRRWATTVTSYLYANASGGLTRVEYTGGRVVVEDYNSQFTIQSSRDIGMELPIWGGFFAGADYNFLVFGQNNENESDSVEVIRVVKYSKDWQRLGQASLYGANTIHPFAAGSVRFAEYGGYLYVRTCHEMYKSSDGLNHQANMMLVVQQSGMKITDSFSTPEFNVGYVSHSFNQFILVDQEQRIVTLDHGDAYPRSALLQRYVQKAGQDTFHYEEIIWTPTGDGMMTGKYADACETAELVAFPDATVNNDTGAALGGLAEAANGYAVAYNYDGTASDLGTDDRAVYLSFTNKSMTATSTIKLSSGGDTSVPVLAPTGLDGGYVMWNGRTSSSWYSYSCDSVLYYAHYDGKGYVGAVQTAAAPLSDCAPIYWNGKVVWYVTNNSVPTFYTLSESGVTSRQAAAGTTSTPAANLAYTNTQTVLLDGKSVEFQTYALVNSTGGVTNYIKLRDLAYYLNGTKVQFSVDWQYGKGITLTTGQPYTPNGSELSTPFSGNRAYVEGSNQTVINSVSYDVPAIILTDDDGGAYTYYQLRDMGRRLGFNVSYINGQIVVNTSEPYSDAQ